MRTVSTAMAAHLATRSHSRCWMLKLVLADGTMIGLTGHDRPISFDLADGGGTLTYSAKTGILPSDVAMAASLDADNYEFSGPIGDVITQQMAVGGRLNMARAFLFQICWRHKGHQAIKIMAGNVTDINQEGGRFIAEVRSDFHRYQDVVGRQITTECVWDYGDANCGATVEEVTVTVTDVDSDMEITVSGAGTPGDHYFDFGKMIWVTGDLVGGKPDEVFQFLDAGTIELFEPAVDLPAVGDTARLLRGCPKNRPGCMARGRMKSYGGYPDSPGNEAVMRAAIPGQGNG